MSDQINSDIDVHAVAHTDEMEWTSSPSGSDETYLERWAPHSSPGIIAYEQGAELFVLDGEFIAGLRLCT